MSFPKIWLQPQRLERFGMSFLLHYFCRPEEMIKLTRRGRESRVGKRRVDALREMVLRTGVPDLATFVSAVIQADQLGVAMSKVMRIQSDQMRIKRRQRAEEQAHRAPVIMIFPMVFLIFPAMYVVILGPSVPKFAHAFFGM